ncbi:MEDS domain-containing protein [Streptomyces sp. MRC013]|uniref:MEDS domain-containing protein n=1 Tax=Streptomyces sp. MRC013 TaxID=2898276 RepID=UPI0020266785|nr:MEDS domain-containing protein [Streptomyces sp. MRC013]URM88824.1 MEDS domain-containing protein [Streptomyces sp. MRC013]
MAVAPETAALPGRTPAAGRHAAVVFSDDRQWAEHLCGFVRSGLDHGEQVRYFADTTEPERVLRTLTDAGIDAAAAVTRGQLCVSIAVQTYLAGAAFDPDAMIGLWHDAVEAASARGHRGLRAIGEMSWGGRDVAGADRLLEYELRVHHEVFERRPLTAWCFYDRRLLPDACVDLLAGAHPAHRGEPVAEPTLHVAPLADGPGFLMSGSAGYDTRIAVAAVAAAVRGASAQRMELDLTALRHLDAASLAVLADAAAERPGGGALRVRRPPPSLRRLLELFPALDSAVEVVTR